MAQVTKAELAGQVEALKAKLAEALEQQAGTAEILRIISNSPTGLQRMLDAVAENAARLCAARDASIFRREGDLLRVVADYGSPSAATTTGSMPLSPSLVVGRAVLEGQTIHVHDLSAALGEYPESARFGIQIGVRTLLVVPLIREGTAIGAIAVRRTTVQPFTNSQVALLQTFADQAVIAIENVRLFNELEARNHDLTDALDRQTATADILRVISQAQADIQPVFETIADSAMRLFGAWSAAVFRYEGELIRVAAVRGGLPGSAEAYLERHQAPRRPVEESPPNRAVLTRAVQHVVDVDTDPSLDPRFREDARLRGFRSAVAVPMLREGAAVGAIAVTRAQAGGFTPVEIALLQTFADQAVIAVENARLLSELQARNADLTEALEQQTATSEILRVISSSPTDAQPVFDTIARSAMRLCEGSFGVVSRYDGELVHLVAHTHVTREGAELIRQMFPTRASRQGMHGRVVLEGGDCPCPGRPGRRGIQPTACPGSWPPQRPRRADGTQRPR